MMMYILEKLLVYINFVIIFILLRYFNILIIFIGIVPDSFRIVRELIESIENSKTGEVVDKF